MMDHQFQSCGAFRLDPTELDILKECMEVVVEATGNAATSKNAVYLKKEIETLLRN